MKLRAVPLRFAYDTKLRDAIIDFTDNSRHAPLWAADIYRRVRARGGHFPVAVWNLPAPG